MARGATKPAAGEANEAEAEKRWVVQDVNSHRTIAMNDCEVADKRFSLLVA
jgi:hypothetical protein